MKYLLVALINAVYGIILLVSITKDTPGVILIIFIGAILATLGLVGFGLWLWEMIASIKEQPKRAQLALKSWWQIAKGIDVLLILGLLFRFLVLQPFLVDGNSMEPNFHDKEYLLVNQLTYRIRAPQRGETIVFRYPKDPQEDFIKRIVGLPRETLEIGGGQVLINGQLLQEDYINSDEALLREQSQITLGNDEYFVLGDNRNHSSDSRDWGILPRKNIIGRAWLVVYPFRYWGLVKNPAVNFSLAPSFSVAS